MQADQPKQQPPAKSDPPPPVTLVVQSTRHIPKSEVRSNG